MNDPDLIRCLQRRGILMEEFSRYLNGTWVEPVEEDDDADISKASPIELIQPVTYESPTAAGYLKVKLVFFEKKKLGQPRPLFRLFLVFSNKHNNFYNK